MPVRLRITFVFVILVMIILGVVCGGIYYFSYKARMNGIEIRLTNRAITTAKLLNQKEIFDKELVQRIDSVTTIALKNKTVQAYDASNRKVYSYSDVVGDTFNIENQLLDDTRREGSNYFVIDDKEAVAYHYLNDNANLIIISAAEDVDGRETLHTLRNILLLSFLVGTALVLVIGYIFSTSLLLPVKKIASDVEEISAQNLTRRIKTGNTKDEWYKLASTLNRLLNRLQESFELQRTFISNASHELSTPLTSISSQLEVSLQRERDTEYYKKVMQSIYQDVRHMSKLTKTLLEFAKASGNAGGLEINLVRIDEIILRLPSEASKINAEYVVSLQFEGLPENHESLLVFGNEELLLTAIKNIVLNACKYSDDHRAEISLTFQDKKIIIVIEDHGKGIMEDDLKNIFQPFYRSGENTTSEGFGLGLPLAARIIKLHKGHIEVSSQLHVGSTFTVSLPSAQSLS